MTKEVSIKSGEVQAMVAAAKENNVFLMESGNGGA